MVPETAFPRWLQPTSKRSNVKAPAATVAASLREAHRRCVLHAHVASPTGRRLQAARDAPSVPCHLCLVSDTLILFCLSMSACLREQSSGSRCILFSASSQAPPSLP